GESNGQNIEAIQDVEHAADANHGYLQFLHRAIVDEFPNAHGRSVPCLQEDSRSTDYSGLLAQEKSFLATTFFVDIQGHAGPRSSK
ncbi:MAG: hypothetical protein O7H40_18290, partial [Gammaproteobacteria bacterium]|nr:hypothetical protein [Gammaproteobacteria bacterium]